MRTLLIHARSFSYNVKTRAIPEAEEINECERTFKASNVLVVFTSIESGDCENPNQVVRDAVNDILNQVRRVKADNVVIYPYAHLTQRLASPECALMILRSIEAELNRHGINVRRAPFGWYKEFALSCYGHPLSELSRTYRVRESASKVVREVLRCCECSQEQILNFINNPVKVNASLSERLKEVISRFGVINSLITSDGIHILDNLSMVNDVIADSIVKKELWIEVNASAVGVKVNTNHLIINQYRNLVADAMRSLSKELINGLAGGRALYLRRLNLLYEGVDAITKCSGDNLNMLLVPVKDVKALNLLIRSASINYHLIKALVRPYSVTLVLRVSDSVIRDYVSYCEELLRRYNVLSYCIIKERPEPVCPLIEALIISKPCNSSLHFPLSYLALTNEVLQEAKLLAIIPLGPFIRALHAIFYNELFKLINGIKPSLPPLITPTHVVVIPVSKEFREYAINVASELRGNGVKAVIDDRDCSLGRRIRDAGRKWVPYIVVTGERELLTGTVNVRDRYTGLQKSMSISELVNRVLREIQVDP